MSESAPPSAALPNGNGNYPASDMGRPQGQAMHVSQYSPTSNRILQPYALAPQQDQSQGPGQDVQSPNQYQQYSYDIQLRYPAPAPSFPAPSMTGRYEPARELPAPLPSMTAMQAQGGFGAPMEMDTTGQVPPPGVKPRVTATLWEDEGTLCFQVDVKGTCVARREDNHMINGTKLLNVVGMTRGRRDGILKSEKQKHVVKIGPMHLKGVWIPYERALEFANKERITELLYPLFVHNIGALLHHPVNHHPAYRTSSSTSPNAHPSNPYPPTTLAAPYPSTSIAPTAAYSPYPPTSTAQTPRSYDFNAPMPPPTGSPEYGRQNGAAGYGREPERQQAQVQVGQGQYQPIRQGPQDQGVLRPPVYS